MGRNVQCGCVSIAAAGEYIRVLRHFKYFYLETDENDNGECGPGARDTGGILLYFDCMEIKIGDSFSRSRLVTDELVRKFAELSGDHNPIHLDDEFAKTTRFGRRIAHGMLSGAFISAVLGYELAERKVVYLSQTMKFTAPVFIGDTVTTTSTVKSIREDKNIITLDTVCTNQSGETVVTGESALMVLP